LITEQSYKQVDTVTISQDDLRNALAKYVAVCDPQKNAVERWRSNLVLCETDDPKVARAELWSDAKKKRRNPSRLSICVEQFVGDDGEIATTVSVDKQVIVE
jgi:hypothetical protein